MPCSHQGLLTGDRSSDTHFRPHGTGGPSTAAAHFPLVSQRPRQSFMAASKGTVSKLRLCTCRHPVKGLQAHVCLSRKICFSVGSSTGFRPVRKSLHWRGFSAGCSSFRNIHLLQHGCCGCHKLRRWLRVVEAAGSSCVRRRAAPCLCSQRPPCSTPSPLPCQHLATYSQYSAHWEYLLGPAPGWTCEWAQQQRD